jgi:hypothetical protein
MKLFLTLTTLLLVVGCAPNIQDRDFEKEEREYIRKYGEKAEKDPLYQEPTEKVVFGGENDGIRVSLARMGDVRIKEGELQEWIATAYNENDEPKCFFIKWKLLDFELITDYYSFAYIDPHETIMDYAKMSQKVWELDGIKLILPASGYIEDIIVKDINEKGKTKREKCEFSVPEKDIEEK